MFNASGHGLGDVEVTARYQLNHGGPDKPYYVGWLRYKSRTGKDLFEVVTDCVTRCVANATGTGLPLELPTGTGFESLQPGVTWLYPSDPVVFFGSFSYLHNFERNDVSRTVLGGADARPLGDVDAGDIFGFNVGMGLALNEKAAISLGYDQSIIGKTKQNGEDVAGSVRVILGTLLLGGSYRFNDRVTERRARRRRDPRYARHVLHGARPGHVLSDGGRGCAGHSDSGDASMLGTFLRIAGRM